MVRTPWFEDPIPFNMAAEIGTQKVITEHSTIGLVITTDGSISDIPREEYEEAEARVIAELKSTNRPYIVLLNCVYPNTNEARALANELAERYNVPVLPVNCMDITEQDIQGILGKLLYQFPVREIRLDIPGWIIDLDDDHWLKKEIFDTLKGACDIHRVCEVQQVSGSLAACEDLKTVRCARMDLGSGACVLELTPMPSLFFKILGEKTGMEVADETALLTKLIEMNEIKKKFAKLQSAYDDVMQTGYGIVMPDMEELTLEEPEIIKQNGKFGIRLKAAAPSIHMMRTCIRTEVTPIVGSEQQSEDLVLYLLKEFEENPSQIWGSNIFGKSLHELVNEGMHNKLARMPEDARGKVRETIERIINDGCNGLSASFCSGGNHAVLRNAHTKRRGKAVRADTCRNRSASAEGQSRRKESHKRRLLPYRVPNACMRAYFACGVFPARLSAGAIRRAACHIRCGAESLCFDFAG